MNVRRHVLSELGLVATPEGDGYHGTAEVRPQMFVPGTSAVRASILAIWTDFIAGFIAVDVIGPRVPVTLELDVHLYEPPSGCQVIHAVGAPLKAGRSITIATVEFTSEAGVLLGVGTGSFLAAPDDSLRLPPDVGEMMSTPPKDLLDVPLAERAGLVRREPGVVELPRTDDGMNSSQTISGGLLALLVEEAALSLTPGATLASMDVRYVRPLRVGPAVATADVRNGLGRIEVRDAGSDDKLGVVATTRVF